MGDRGRTPWLLVDDLPQAAAAAAGRSDRLVVDLENTLLDYGSSAEQRLAAMTAAVEVVAAQGGLERLAFISNGPFTLPRLTHDLLVIHALGSARKPYVRIPPLRRLRTELAGAAVYGDQPLTDGMLARNLGGVWLQPRWAYDRSHEAGPPDSDPRAEPLWPRVMRRAGRRATDRRFRLVMEPAG